MLNIDFLHYAFNDMWDFLSTSPSMGITLTLIAYSISITLFSKGRHHPLLNPVGISIILIISILSISNMSYDAYFDGAKYIHLLLGPATVALAVPLYQQSEKLKKMWLPIILSISGGLSIGAISCIFIARYLGVDIETQLSLTPKSVTAPIAMGISEKINGIPSLAAAFAILTGITGSLIYGAVFTLGRIKDNKIQGIALGTAAHGIGTARAFQMDEETGAFAGLAMAVTAAIAALILPLIVELMM